MFDDDFIDSYVALKREEQEAFEATRARFAFQNVLQRLRVVSPVPRLDGRPAAFALPGLRLNFSIHEQLFLLAEVGIDYRKFALRE